MERPSYVGFAIAMGAMGLAETCREIALVQSLDRRPPTLRSFGGTITSFATGANANVEGDCGGG